MITGRGAFPLHGGIINPQKRRFNRSLGIFLNVPLNVPLNNGLARPAIYSDWFFKVSGGAVRRLLGLLGVG